MEDGHLKLISKSRLTISLKENLSFFRKSLFAPALRNIEHELWVNVIDDFLNFNIVETKNLRHSLKNLIKHRIFDYTYFFTEDEQWIGNATWERLILSRRFGVGHESEVYGNIPSSDITSSDFTKTDYNGFKEYLKNLIGFWRQQEFEEQQIQDFKLIVQKSLEKLLNHVPEHRIYYIMDQDCIPQYRKEPFGFYEYYIIVISTLRYSNQVVVMEFGQD